MCNRRYDEAVVQIRNFVDICFAMPRRGANTYKVRLGRRDGLLRCMSDMS